MELIQPDRRKFLKKLTAGILSAIGGGAGLSHVLASQNTFLTRQGTVLSDEPVIVFQGDSITDSGRDKQQLEPNVSSGLGSGYVFLAASELLGEYPARSMQCYNRGISGNKVFQLAARWEEDCLNLQPDVLGILVGVNDFWHTLTHGYTGTVTTYEKDYRALVEYTLEQLPDVHIIIGEPFVLPEGSAVDSDWFPSFMKYQDVARQIAEDYTMPFLPYQSIFDEASKRAPQTYWSEDGVHPTIAGNYLMAQAWLRLFLLQ